MDDQGIRGKNRKFRKHFACGFKFIFKKQCIECQIEFFFPAVQEVQQSAQFIAVQIFRPAAGIEPAETAVNGISSRIGCGEGALKVLSVIPEGKGRMSAGDLLRGRKLAVGDVLE